MGRRGERRIPSSRDARVRQILVAIATVVAAATSTRSAHEPPTFRGGVGLVELDVSVTDQDGQAVRDLRSDDFEPRRRPATGH